MKKRILSLVLALALLLALLPAGVLAATPVTVQIGGIALEDGKYLPSHGSSLSDTEPVGCGYAVLNGDVLTLCDFVWEGTVYDAGDEILEDVDAEAHKQAINISGNAVLNLVGSSTVITGSYTAVSSDSDLTVTGQGNLRIFGKFNALIAENFVMESGTLFASSSLGGNGIVVKDNVTFIGGDLIIDADYGFYSFDYDNYDDPVITAAPADGTTVTVRYGFRDEEVLCREYSEAGTLDIRSNGSMYQRFWFTDGSDEEWPDMPAAPYDLLVAGVYVTKENCGDVLGDGTVRFDPTTCTLTLDRADLCYKGRVIYASGMDLTVKGENE